MSCLHCGLPACADFCCPGCETVYHVLKSDGLEDFYVLRDTGRPAASPSGDFHRWTAQQHRYVTDAQVRIGVEGMHCAACIWLLEKVLTRVPGVVSARVNLADETVTVLFEECRLGDLVEAIERVGYRATPLDASRAPARGPDLDMLLRLAVAGFGAGNIMMIAAALYAGHFQGIEAHYKRFFEHASLLLSTPVVFYSGQLFTRGALSALRARHLTMDVPITLGMLTTYFYSVWAAVTGRGQVYFDTVAMFVFVLLIGRFLEVGSRRRVSGAMEHLLALRPATARLLEGGEVAVDTLEVGELVVVGAGERIPTDGTVTEGRAWVNESLVTGEANPASRAAGDRVVGSTLVEEGELIVRVEAVAGETVLAQIAQLVQAAQAGATPAQRLIDRAAVAFVAVTLLGALATFLWWLPEGSGRALLVAVSVLIITCPCALGLAVPLAVWSASGSSLGAGVLFRDGEALEKAAGVTDLVLDKTGTLTRGDFQILEVNTVAGVEPAELLSLAAAVEEGQRHPLARALVAAAAPTPEASQAQTLPGLGVKALVAGEPVLVGNQELMREHGLQLPFVADRDQTVVWVARAERIVGCVVLADQVRPEAPQVVEGLRSHGLRLHLVSGDRRGPVTAVAAVLGLESVLWEARPDDKAEFVRMLQSQGRRVAVVGDGVNDAPALSASDLGVALVEGSEIAATAAPVLLLGKSLRPLLATVDLARLALRTVRENLAISACYNLMAIPCAVAGLITPLGAALAMPAASLLVVGNSLRFSRRTSWNSFS